MSKVQDNLLRYINYYGISKARIAHMSNLSVSTIDVLVKGEDYPLRLKQVARAMIVLGVNPDDVLGDEEVNRLLDDLGN